jgi:hypothetical protein
MSISQEIIDFIKELDTNPPLDKSLFQSTLNAININLPADYLGFMKVYNGGEGTIGWNGKYARFWPLEQLLEANDDYLVKELTTDLFLIGSDGGNTAFGIRLSDNVLIEVPFIGMADDEAVARSKNFAGFLEYLSLPYE